MRSRSMVKVVVVVVGCAGQILLVLTNCSSSSNGRCGVVVDVNIVAG